MPEPKWLDDYAGQTVDQLIALEDTHRVDSLLLAFEQALDQKAAKLGDAELTEAEKVILAVEALEREVNNGGYAQFFVNSSSEYASVIVHALRQIGCPKTADITAKALSIVARAPITPEEIEDGSWEDNEERTEMFEACDSAYFDRPENIEARLFAFIKANRNTISL